MGVRPLIFELELPKLVGYSKLKHQACCKRDGRFEDFQFQEITSNKSGETIGSTL